MVYLKGVIILQLSSKSEQVASCTPPDQLLRNNTTTGRMVGMPDCRWRWEECALHAPQMRAPLIVCAHYIYLSRF